MGVEAQEEDMRGDDLLATSRKERGLAVVEAEGWGVAMAFDARRLDACLLLAEVGEEEEGEGEGEAPCPHCCDQGPLHSPSPLETSRGAAPSLPGQEEGDGTLPLP